MTNRSLQAVFNLSPCKVIAEGGHSFVAAGEPPPKLQVNNMLEKPRGIAATTWDTGGFRQHRYLQVTYPITSKTEEDWADGGECGARRMAKN